MFRKILSVSLLAAVTATTALAAPASMNADSGAKGFCKMLFAGMTLQDYLKEGKGCKKSQLDNQLTKQNCKGKNCALYVTGQQCYNQPTLNAKVEMGYTQNGKNLAPVVEQKGGGLVVNETFYEKQPNGSYANPQLITKRYDADTVSKVCAIVADAQKNYLQKHQPQK